MPGCAGHPRVRDRRSARPVRVRGAARRVRRSARHRRVGHQSRLQHGPRDPALGNGRRRAHRAELRLFGARGERRRRPTRGASTPRRASRSTCCRCCSTRRRAACSTSTFPALDYDDVLGVRWARLAAFGSVRPRSPSRGDGRLQFELRATGVAAAARLRPGLVDAGYASLTTIVGVAEAWPTEIGRPASRVVERRARRDRSNRCTRCPTRRRRTRCTARCTRARSRSGSSSRAPRRGEIGGRREATPLALRRADHAGHQGLDMGARPAVPGVRVRRGRTRAPTTSGR